MSKIVYRWTRIFCGGSSFVSLSSSRERRNTLDVREGKSVDNRLPPRFQENVFSR